MKKIIPLLLFGVSICINLFGQIQKNTIFVESTANYNFQKAFDTAPFNRFRTIGQVHSETKITNLSTTFGVGYALSEKDIVGASFKYGRLKSRIDQEFQNTFKITLETGEDTTTVTYVHTPITGSSSYVQEDNTTQLSFGIYYRRMIPISKRITFAPRLDLLHEREIFTSEQISYGQNNESQRSSSDIKMNSAAAELSTAVIFQVNKWLGIQTKVFSGKAIVVYQDTQFSFDKGIKRITATVDANPIHWELGVLFILGNKNKE